LAALIKEHLVTGEAVGSRVLSDRFSHGYGWSPATIRNVMSELEETGFVDQPHTSAGRVPTDKGYRYYVDNMLGEARLSRNDLKAIDHLFFANDIGADASPDRLMETASHVLSALSENVGIVVSPSLADNRLNHIEFVLLPDKRILVVLVSTANIIHNKVIRTADELTQDDLDRTARYLNTEFSGKSLLAIRAEIVELMKEEKALYSSRTRFCCVSGASRAKKQAATFTSTVLQTSLPSLTLSISSVCASCSGPSKRSRASLRFSTSVSTTQPITPATCTS
jgi:heat-inducible transcriptional repressor